MLQFILYGIYFILLHMKPQLNEYQLNNTTGMTWHMAYFSVSLLGQVCSLPFPFLSITLPTTLPFPLP